MRRRSSRPCPTIRRSPAACCSTHERTANCPLFTKLIKQILEERGVQFRLGREVSAIRLDGQRAAVELVPLTVRWIAFARSRLIAADAIVVAAGIGSLALLERLNCELPLHPLRLHTLIAPIALRGTRAAHHDRRFGQAHRDDAR